ncbi:glycosyltransferase [Patulibacter sp.]|uniref:glycosyltransferase n=1 Tax=Patulibacter sp. TaxID=1912859 RepID=UPI00272805AB|nr:glycosyltransferase [Patulibacter sp.]MDO9409536.1 glycosyltransferase [Patulibacter sp.]
MSPSPGSVPNVPPALSRCDLHVHSTASEFSKLGVQRSVGMPECATPPEEVYELAKRRGMDFVTITDHDTIAGALQIADRPDVFVGEELTVWFRGEPQAVHVLCLGITQDDHDWLQAHNHDVVRCAEYLHQNEITTALAHPFYSVEAPLTARHRRQLAELFPIWEVRNGSRARELNAPAATFIDVRGGIGIGGTDDHAGVDIGRTFTETPLAYTPEEYLAHIRAGRAVAKGTQGSAAKWTHAAMGIAIRSLGVDPRGEAPDAPIERPRPEAIATMVSSLMTEGDVRRGSEDQEITPDDARMLLRAWLDAVGLRDLTARQLLAMFQEDDFDHRDLFRRARTAHEGKLAETVEAVVAAAERVGAGEEPDLTAIGGQLLDALLPALPYAPAAAFLGRERRKLKTRLDGELPRVALVADGIGGMHGVTHTIDTLRRIGVPGYEVEVIGTDVRVDRRLPAVADVDIPFYAGLQVGIPGVPALVEQIAEGRYDVVHLCSPGPAGIVAGALAKMLDIPVLASYHTELGSYTGLRSADPRLQTYADLVLAVFYGQADVVVTPSPQSDEAVRQLGVAADAVGRWDRGVDVERFRPTRRSDETAVRVLGAAPNETTRVNVLYAGRQSAEKGVDLLCDTFLRARARDPRLHMVLAGGGPEEHVLRERLGEHATFLGWLSGDDLADAYANADVFLFASRTDTFGQVLLEAQASGLPIVAVGEGGPLSIVEDGVSGLLRPADAGALSDALVAVAGRPGLRRRLALGGLMRVQDRTWEAAMGRLADGYARALAAGTLRAARREAEASAARELVRPKTGQKRVA